MSTRRCECRVADRAIAAAGRNNDATPARLAGRRRAFTIFFLILLADRPRAGCSIGCTRANSKIPTMLRWTRT